LYPQRKVPLLLIDSHLAEPFVEDHNETPADNRTSQRSGTVPRGTTAKRSSDVPLQSSAAPSGGERLESSGPAIGTGTASTGSRQIATDPGGIAIGGSPSSGAGTSSPGKRLQLGTGTASGSGGASSSGGAAKIGPRRPQPIPPIVIPEAIGGTTSPYEGEIYVDVDVHILFEADMRVGIPVPGNEVCLEGDQIRTINPFTFKETKTDNSM
jgi:hypothetical protein